MGQKIAWPGGLRLGLGWALYVGPAGDTEIHAHHAIQIAVGLDGPVELGFTGGVLPPALALLVLPDIPHRLLGGGQPMALLFLEPESALGRSLIPYRPGQRAWALEDAQARSFQSAFPEIAAASGPASEGRLLEHLQALSPQGRIPPEPMDPRVLRAIRRLKAHGGVGSLNDAAQAQGLSPSRLGHLFSEQVGLPFRPFALWFRLQGVLGYLAQGANLTQAAHGAGFSDSAHLTRTFRRMFGITPSSLAGFCEIPTMPPIEGL